LSHIFLVGLLLDDFEGADNELDAGSEKGVNLRGKGYTKFKSFASKERGERSSAKSNPF